MGVEGRTDVWGGMCDTTFELLAAEPTLAAGGTGYFRPITGNGGGVCCWLFVVLSLSLGFCGVPAGVLFLLLLLLLLSLPGRGKALSRGSGTRAACCVTSLTWSSLLCIQTVVSAF